MKDTIIYGIPNCDTVKKTLAWFKAQDLPYKFHDYKILGISSAKLSEWATSVDWQELFNKKSSTWRLVQPEMHGVSLTKQKAIKLMTQHTSVIKRPVVECEGKLLVGFNEAQYRTQFLNNKKTQK